MKNITTTREQSRPNPLQAHELILQRFAQRPGPRDGASSHEQRSDLLVFILRGYVQAIAGPLSFGTEFPARGPAMSQGVAALESDHGNETARRGR
jgi:hypothetical protein